MDAGWHGVDWSGDHAVFWLDDDGWLHVRTYGDSDTGPVVQLNPEQVVDLLATLNAATVAA